MKRYSELPVEANPCRQFILDQLEARSSAEVSTAGGGKAWS
jgi:hypothetical protein